MYYQRRQEERPRACRYSRVQVCKQLSLMLLPGSRLRRLRALARQTGSSVVHQAVADAEPQEDWGEGEGYPVTEPGWQPKPGQFAIDDRRKTRVGNYSGGCALPPGWGAPPTA